MIEAPRTCSQCGSVLDDCALRANTCRKCLSPILVRSLACLSGVDSMSVVRYVAQYPLFHPREPSPRDFLLAMGICHLKLGVFDEANRSLDRLISAHPTDPAGYYYRAIANLEGKRPRLASRLCIQETERLLIAARDLDPGDGRYEIVIAAVRHDHYAGNGFAVPDPTPELLVAKAIEKRFDAPECEEALGLLQLKDGPVGRRCLV